MIHWEPFSPTGSCQHSPCQFISLEKSESEISIDTDSYLDRRPPVKVARRRSMSSLKSRKTCWRPNAATSSRATMYTMVCIRRVAESSQQSRKRLLNNHGVLTDPGLESPSVKISELCCGGVVCVASAMPVRIPNCLSQLLTLSNLKSFCLCGVS